MSGLLRDLLHAWRSLKQKPGFLVASLLTLTLGIGANVTIFSLVNGLSLRPMPFGDRTDRLVTIHPTHNPEIVEPDWGDAEISYADLQDFRNSSSVEGIGAYYLRNFVLSGDASSAERVLGGSISPELFPMLGIEPMMGRQFRPEEATAPSLESVVMLTHGLWQRRYGSDPLIVGKTIIVNDRARTVIGVLPPGIRFPLNDQLYMPLRWDEAPRSSRNINAVALLKPGVTSLSSRTAVQSRNGSRSSIRSPTKVTAFVVPIRRPTSIRRRSHGRDPHDRGGLRPADHVREPDEPDAGARRLPPA